MTDPAAELARALDRVTHDNPTPTSTNATRTQRSVNPTGLLCTKPVPVPVQVVEEHAPVSVDANAPQMRVLRRLHRGGEVEPVKVALGQLPEDATPAMRAVAADLELAFGLRLADGDDRPLPYATSEPVTQAIVRTRGGSSYVLHRLEDAGVVWSPGSMEERRGKPDGTRLFLPGPRPQGPEPAAGWRVLPAASDLHGMPGAVRKPGAVPIERQNVMSGVPFEPLVELPQQSSVRDAHPVDPAGGGAFGLHGVLTTDGGAVGQLGHASDDTRGIGGGPVLQTRLDLDRSPRHETDAEFTQQIDRWFDGRGP